MIMTDTVFCEQCGARLSASARFCTERGSEQADATVKTPTTDKAIRHHEASGSGCRLGSRWRTTSRLRRHGACASIPKPSAEQRQSPPAGAMIAINPPPARVGAEPVLPMIGELRLELWLVIAAFALPGGWIVFTVVKALPDAIKALGTQFFGFRIGLALTMILVLVGLLSAGMLVIAWKLYHRERVARGLAYALGGTIVVSVLFSNARTSAET
jgi:hypothetical protein